jgi:hypothetical protein
MHFPWLFRAAIQLLGAEMMPDQYRMTLVK